ncbi:DUF885 domain-containing protein [Croceicoccus gelatinilyticus]|uniref:DUF885 domain-containing protein n=1 Tax=Croceicoccus gelatinilyticus TaxID=2835536 RepID=UPI001BCAC44F|nr:DUF885 family protein [Croceicoccus gelatinilyticus]MBS7670126.1 DUF885 family protein [Croceicoccus gelatinilyticus]
MHRRQFIASASIASIAAAAPRTALAQADASSQLDTVLDAAFWGDKQLSPESLTSAGLDDGRFAWARHAIDNYGEGGTKARMALSANVLESLKRVPESGLSEAKQTQRAIAIDMMEKRLLATKYDLPNVGNPFVVEHRSGAYVSIPVMLDTKHPVETTDDAEAYLDRLDAFAGELDAETEYQKAQGARGYLPPVWSLEMTAKQIDALMAPAAAESGMVSSLATRAAEKGIEGDWAARATKILEDAVYPALARQSEAMRALKADTPAGDGAWRLPRGEEIYADALKLYTTTDLSPEEIHQIGLRQVDEIHAELEPLLQSAGLTKGPVGARMAELYKRPDQLYANTPAGKAELLESLNEQTAAMMEKLPQAFNTVPTQPLEIRAVPEAIQDGASGGYYHRPSLDGSRPGIYWINLKDTANWPKFFLPALTYHEGVPGHHLHGSLMQQAEDLPLLLKGYFISAYGEGWALYAEQVANELGGYSGLEQIGRLQSWLYRATRLVTDTGLHYKRWDIAKATDYFQNTIGLTYDRSLGETQRYCVMIGQACSYKIGQNKWMDLRAKAERELGDKFVLGRFHDILLEGVMPLNLLEKRVDAFIARERGA